ncbi:NAD-binding protein [Leptolyngbya sp. FACHB-261]|uniref:potassium channel family protein n=1 Tax=Leptolyngbya sp. FACHB-261 TaxID=2692806 RepID=UPI001681D2F3|nr:NAD-binding protein [Leptolyngbya sp. FACHB-261]MBD2099520.1 TrkA family potassium uptake protein [Leptolyngbya sp. FACHB-261]
MNLTSLSFFRNLRPDNKQFAVVGLGRFGRAVSSTLHSLGYEVLGVDVDEKRVAQVATEQQAAHCLQLDSTDPLALKESGIFEFDTVIVAIGNYLQESIITTLHIKEAGVNHVVAKASSDVHGTLLKKVGADLVVYPESEMGCTLARSLTQTGILDRFELDPDNSIVEVMVPDEFDGKTILELKLRSQYGVSILAVSHNDKFEINPNPNQRLQRGSAIVVIGSNKDISRLPIACKLAK